MEKYENIDIKEQIYKIICKYVSSSQYIKESLRSFNGELQEFIDIAYFVYIDKFYKNYDKDIAKITTHIYSCLDKHISTILREMKYSIDFNRSRNLGKLDKENNEKSMQILNPSTIDTCSTTLDIDSNNDFNYEKELYSTIDLAEEDKNLNNILSQECEKAFYNILDYYLKNYKCKDENNKLKIRKIVLAYTFQHDEDNPSYYGKITYNYLANKYGISRQRVEQFVNKFYNFVKYKTNFREMLES